MNKVTIGFCIVILLGTLFVFSNIEKNMGDVAATTGTEEIDTREILSAKLITYRFDDAVRRADLIVEIIIQEHLEDITHPAPKTIFSAKVSSILSGETDVKNIKIMQQGNQEVSINGNALFSKEEKYILFLKNVGEDSQYSPDTYWILGEETNIYKVIDNNTIKKMALNDSLLNEIEIKDNDQFSQLLDKELFEEKVEMIISR